MSTHSNNGKMAAVNTPVNQQSQDLNHVGPLQGHTVGKQSHLHRHDLNDGRLHPHAHAVEQQSSKVSTAFNEFLAGCSSAYLPQQGRFADPYGSDSLQKSQTCTLPPAFENKKMRRWYMEKAHEQPWNPFRLETGPPSHGQHKI